MLKKIKKLHLLLVLSLFMILGLAICSYVLFAYNSKINSNFADHSNAYADNTLADGTNVGYVFDDTLIVTDSYKLNIKNDIKDYELNHPENVYILDSSQNVHGNEIKKVITSIPEYIPPVTKSDKSATFFMQPSNIIVVEGKNEGE